MPPVNVRYMVHDIDTAIAFYATHLGFTLRSRTSPAFADVTHGELRLLLSAPSSSAGRPMPDGVRPEPGGWNRIQLIVDDLEAEVQRLRAASVPFRKEAQPNPLLHLRARRWKASPQNLGNASTRPGGRTENPLPPRCAGARHTNGAQGP